MTGSISSMRLDEIERETNTAVFCYGRINPPTLGHQKLIHKGRQVAEEVGGDFFVFPTHSHTPKKKPTENLNPLDLETKMRFLNEVFPEVEFVPEHSQTLFGALFWLLEQGYNRAYMVTGSDRVETFRETIFNYIPYKNPDVDPEKAVDFEFFEVINAGERDPDSQGVEGASGSKARQYVIEGKINKFRSIVPGKAKTKTALYKAVKKGLGV